MFRRSRRWSLLALSALLLGRGAVAAASGSSVSRYDEEEEEEVIVVTTVGGDVAGVSRASGAVLWSRSSSEARRDDDDVGLFAPLVSTKTTRRDHGDGASSWETSAVPSVDGRVFGRDRSSSVADIVARAPFRDGEGRVWTGSRTSTAAALDRRTGETLRALSSRSNDDHRAAFASWRGARDPDRAVWVGRVDHAAVARDPRTGRAEAEFSCGRVTSVREMVGWDDEDEGDDDNDEGVSGQLLLPDGATTTADENDGARSSFLPRAPTLLSTPRGRLALRDADAGTVAWVTPDLFRTPVVFAVDASSGRSLRVHVLPDGEEDDEDDLRRRAQRDLDVHSRPPTNVPPFVGRLANGEPYALPLGPIAPARLSYSYSYGDDFHALSSSSSLWSSSRRPPRNPHWPRLGYENKYENEHEFFAPPPPPPPSSRRSWFRTLLRVLTSWIPPAVALAFVLSFEMGRRERLRANNIKLSYAPPSFLRTLAGRTKEEEHSVTTIASPSLPSPSPSPSLKQNNTTIDDGVIEVSNDVLGYGGHGTIVYRGRLGPRSVAVKRMLRAHHADADREISLLISSDGHPNVVRYFLKEVRHDFVHLALELCDLSLHDLVAELRRRRDDADADDASLTRRREAMRRTLRGVSEGVRHIHDLRIVHRDLKPQNILLRRRGQRNDGDDDDDVVAAFEKDDLVPKISDMGLGKQLVGQQSSFGPSTLLGHGGRGGSEKAAAPGSVGWQAPEVMSSRFSSSDVPSSSSSSSGRTSRSVDVFSLGCVFHTALTDGRHPFGEWYEREANIMRDRRPTEHESLAAVSVEAADLVDRMIDRDARHRPTARDVCAHPYFWDAPRRAAFLCELSDRLEASHHATTTTTTNTTNNNNNNNNNNDVDPTCLESGAAEVVGRAWDRRLDAALVTDTSRFRSYDPSSVRDCLRFVRNKHRHFDELSEETRAAVGVADARDLARYFDAVFPRLLPHCYDVCRNHLDPDDALRRKYRIVGASSRPETTTKSEENNDDMSTTNETRKGCVATPTPSPPITSTPTTPVHNTPSLVAWRDSETAASLGCLGWSRSTAFWVGEPASALRTKHAAASTTTTTRRPGGANPRYRTRLCNHWDVSKGVRCPLRRKRCVFAHGPVELRVKEGKRGRWGRLVDRKGDCSNLRASGGEDTYGAARDVENARKGEGKWSTDDAVAVNSPHGRRKGKQRGGIPTGA